MKSFIVLGTPHSGTSLVAGLLHSSGVSMGSTFSYDRSNQDINPHGYFEDRAFADTNSHALSQAGGSHLDPPPPEDVISTGQAQQLEMRVRGLIHGYAQRGEDWGFKCPRTIVLWEFYKPHIKPEYNPHVIICWRNPLNIARAWKRHNELPTVQQGLKLAAWYAEQLAQAAYEFPATTIHVAFEEWWHRFEDQAAALARFCGRELALSFFDEALWRS